MDASEVTPQIEPPTVKLRQLSDLPGPVGLPFFGSALQIKIHLFHQQLEKWSYQYGDFFRVKVGPRTLLIIADHHALDKVMRDRPEGFHRTAVLTEVWTEMGFQEGVFVANGEVWNRQRRMVVAGFAPAHVKAYFPSLCKVTDRLEARWKKNIGSDIELLPDLMRFTVDVITGLAFGTEVNTIESGDDIIQHHLDKIFPAIYKRNLAIFKYWKYFRLPSDRALDKSVAEVNAAIRGFISQARERIKQNPNLKENPMNLLEAMINAADQPESGLTDADVAGNVLTMLLAGEDTTANSLAWLLALLWKNPEVLEQLKQEMRSKFAKDKPYSTELLNELVYLDACINESMRLKPVATMLPFQAAKDTVIGDIFVPANTPIFGLLRHDTVDEKFVPDPDKFEPKRWMTEGETNPSINSVKRISRPFGGGPRICPGRYLALLEMKILMTMLLTRFDIEAISTPDGKEAQEYLAFTMAPVGLKMRLTLS